MRVTLPSLSNSLSLYVAVSISHTRTHSLMQSLSFSLPSLFPFFEFAIVSLLLHHRIKLFFRSVYIFQTGKFTEHFLSWSNTPIFKAELLGGTVLSISLNFKPYPWPNFHLLWHKISAEIFQLMRYIAFLTVNDYTRRGYFKG